MAKLELPPTFQYEKNGKIAVMTINRPEAMNAFTADMLHGMDAAFADFNDDPDLCGSRSSRLVVTKLSLPVLCRYGSQRSHSDAAIRRRDGL